MESLQFAPERAGRGARLAPFGPEELADHELAHDHLPGGWHGGAAAAPGRAAAVHERPRRRVRAPRRAPAATSATAWAAGPVHGGGVPSPQKIRRRNRLITSCLEVPAPQDLKCDKTHPCTNCTKFVRDCVYLAPALDPAAQMKLAEIKEKMGSLERTLEEDVARRARRRGQGGGRRRSSSGSSDDEIRAPRTSGT